VINCPVTERESRSRSTVEVRGSSMALALFLERE
jgi:hypothetical protein